MSVYVSVCLSFCVYVCMSVCLCVCVFTARAGMCEYACVRVAARTKPDTSFNGSMAWTKRYRKRYLK